MSWLEVVQEVGHWSAALPLLACFLLCLKKRDPSPDAWLLSGAFFISVIADSVAVVVADYGMTNNWLEYIYTPIQFGLFVAVLTQARALRTVALFAVMLFAIVSATRGTLGAPETVVQVLGGGLVGLLALDHPSLGKYLPALLVYCWVTIPLLLLMGTFPPAIDGVWIWAWVIYQLVRVTAVVLMVGALIRQPVLRLLEVGDGPATDKTAHGWRGPFRITRRHSGDPVAEASGKPRR